MATKYWISTSSTSFNTAGNWSDGVAPAHNDTLIFNHLGTANCSTNTSTSLTGVTVIVEMSYTGQIGSLSSIGVAVYLRLDGGTVYIGRKTPEGSGPGPGLVMISNLDSGSSTDMTINVLDSASSNAASTYYPPINVYGSGITLNVSGGNVGVNLVPGTPQSAQLDALRVVQTADAGVTPKVTLGPGVSVTTITANAGEINNYSDNTITSATIVGNATYNYLGTGAHTTLEAGDNGVVYYTGTGTVTTGNIRGATLDCSRDARTKTFTTLNLYRGSTLDIDNGRAGSIVFTNAINYHDGIDGVTLRTPPQVKGTLTNI